MRCTKILLSNLGVLKRLDVSELGKGEDLYIKIVYTLCMHEPVTDNNNT